MIEIPPFESTLTDARVAGLATQYPAGLIGLPLEPVRLSWQVLGASDGASQAAYQVAWRSETGLVDWQEAAPVGLADSIGVEAPGGPLRARERRQYRLRVALEDGWTRWSQPIWVEGGLGSAEWQASLISIPSQYEGATPLLRCQFDLPGEIASARLYASGLGFYEPWLNGERASQEYMNPGWTAYQARILVQTFDVGCWLRPGQNCLGLVLGDGWYRGRLGAQQKHGLWGDSLAGLAQLEVTLTSGAAVTVVTDQTWRGGFGWVTATCLYDGTTADQRLTGPEFAQPGYDDSSWQPVTVLPTDYNRFVPRNAPGVKLIDHRPMAMTPADGRVMLDAGQNLAGWVKLTVKGQTGDKVTIRHAEVLNPDGTLHLHALRGAKPFDHYTLGHDGRSVLEPVHTYHGFRYCDVVGQPELVEATAQVASCDLPARSTFECSHPGLNQFHANALWSLRSNFMSVPSDCPQRDERLGWTGDAAAFAATANTLVDAASFWQSWLTDLALEQRADGSVPSTVPNVFETGDLVMNGVVADPWGRSAWADAVTLVPAAVYESYGDKAILAQNLEPMRRWVEHLRARAGSDVVIPEEPFQWGDWLDPDAPGGRPWESKVTPQFVANAYYVRSARLLAAAETLVGEPGRAAAYAQLGNQVAAESWRRWREDAFTTQTGGALALEYGIAPQSERQAVADALAKDVQHQNGRIATGFIGARLILFALARNGHIGQAYQMLLRREPPSWLYQVDQGATTVWERWDAILPDGSIHTGAMDTVTDDVMVSFNHYAYGAMVDWLYRFTAGLEPLWDQPGYQGVVVQPRPTPGVTWAKAGIDTALGRLAIDWRLTDNDQLVIDLVVPFGAMAHLNLPLGADSEVVVGGQAGPAALSHGRHHITVTHPAIA